MILKNCRFIAELIEGYNERHGDIVIKEGRIKDIFPAGSTENMDGVVVDCKGKTVLPGLFDLHVHFGVSGDDVMVDNAKPLPYRTLEAYQFAQDTLKAGFTTVRDVGDVDYISIALRDLIAQGKLVGPRMRCSGRIVTVTEQGNDYFKGMYNEADTAAEVRKAARQEIKAGADFLKTMISGAISNPGGEPGMTICREDEVLELVNCARERGTYVAAHCHGIDSIKLALRCGVRTIEHATLMDDEIIATLKEGKAYAVPTLSAISKLNSTTNNFSEFMQKKTDSLLNAHYTCLRQAYQVGLILGFGTDAGTTDNYHGSNGGEFIYRYERINMKPVDILKQATINSAFIMGLDQDLGTLKIGKLADFVVIDGNPDENIYLMRDAINMVIKEGQIVYTNE